MPNKQLTIRKLIIGAVGSVILTMSSMFTALKLSSVPWLAYDVRGISIDVFIKLEGFGQISNPCLL